MGTVDGGRWKWIPCLLLSLASYPDVFVGVMSVDIVKDFEIILNWALTPNMTTITFTGKPSILNCREACFVDPECKTVTAFKTEESKFTCQLYNEVVEMKDMEVYPSAITLVRIPGYDLVGSLYCTLTHGKGDIAYAEDECENKLAIVQDKSQMIAIIKYLRDKEVSSVWLSLRTRSMRTNPMWTWGSNEYRYDTVANIDDVVTFQWNYNENCHILDIGFLSQKPSILSEYCTPNIHRGLCCKGYSFN
ncbi:uncharacterized protein LOC143019475 [Oratosquilla oratoria]|uniref:uncharacterized protein LOC143019475 n=1 Tax=Oratosquilla oratoria TaxID=337810 RepID=UPI003F76A0FA